MPQIAPPLRKTETPPDKQKSEPSSLPQPKKSHKLRTVLIIISVLIILGAGLLGIFWDKIFS